MWSYNVANNNGLCVMWYEIYYRYRNNDLLVTSWQNIERKKWNITHELVQQIDTQQLDYKKHCAKSTGWWLFTLAAGDLQKLNLCGSSQFVENHFKKKL